MKEIASYSVFILQCFLLMSLHVLGVTEAEGVNLSLEKHVQAPDGLVQAERHALETDNHKLGEEDFVQPAKHLIPFDKHHFDFKEEDWSVYILPHTKGEQMIASISPDLGKELTISTIIKPMSNIIITYQIHLTANIGSAPPTFSVFIITNETKSLLKEETTQELWKTTSLFINTQKSDSELLFVGVLNGPSNKIALRSFTVQDGSALTNHRYGTFPNLPESEDILTGSDTHGDSFYNENDSELHPHSLGKAYFHPNASSINRNDHSMHLTDGHHDNSSYSSYNDSSLSGHDYTDFENGHLDDSVYDENVTDLQFPSSVTDEHAAFSVTNVSFPAFAINSSTSVDTATNYNNSLTTETNATESEFSVAKGVFNFFLVVIVCSIAVIGYLFWRRRRNQKEDEIPVFSRNATEHGNPTFNDTETHSDVGANRDNQSNYRTIE